MGNTITLILLLLTVFASDAKSQSSSLSGRQQSNREVTEITLERRGCHGLCPVYKVVLRKYGMSEYICNDGEIRCKREGRYEAKIYPTDFVRLANLIETNGYFDLKDKYLNSGPGPWSSTSVKRNDVWKTVEDDEAMAPIELWGIQQAIEGVVQTRMGWKKVS